MLWNEIFVFYVTHVFGGTLYINGEDVDYYSILGGNGTGESLKTCYVNTSTPILYNNDEILNFSLGNYLSMIATIITIIAILLFCVFIIKKIIGIVFRLFTGSSAF